MLLCRLFLLFFVWFISMVLIIRTSFFWVGAMMGLESKKKTVRLDEYNKKRIAHLHSYIDNTVDIYTNYCLRLLFYINPVLLCEFVEVTLRGVAIEF